ncbi:MAG: ankyrin repeat domain-containing protein [Acidobacteria bacterium]|nr:ankyrin repeat domain-containing protein [Acidobacteriota bacterium]MBS1865289.1 ankyrin repeat domain-containing protein [Acidobacteriota bacterium]
MTLQLPERANLEQLKKQAKSLLTAARNQEPDAIQRFEAVLIGRSLKPEAIALHDAQFVLAREYGFKSWNELKDEVEERSLSFAAAVDEFVRCATGNAPERAFRLLARHSGIAHANLYTELVLGDAEAVEARLKADPGMVRQRGGVQNWEPLLYVCHTFLQKDSPERTNGLVKIARELLRLGANPNAEYDWNWHPELPRTALWGALIATGQIELAQLLLESGANPTDGVSMHIAAGSGNIAALDLLDRFGANANGIAGSVPPLAYILGWMKQENIESVGWLLSHKADPNLAWAQAGDSPLHIAAQRLDIPTVELLVSNGADVNKHRPDGRTAYALAALHGNDEVASWLLKHGAKDELSPLDRFVAACTSGNKALAQSLLNEHPNLRNELRAEHHLMMHTPAERGEAKILETMLACGFDPNVKDSNGVEALHRAAMGGHVEAVRVLLARGASVNAVDGMFAATPLVWACEGWRHEAKNGADHVGVARLLLAAGSPHEWAAPEKAPDAEGTHERLAELCQVAQG